jgi:hypothetical protein
MNDSYMDDSDDSHDNDNHGENNTATFSNVKNEGGTGQQSFKHRITMNDSETWR